MYNFSKKQNKDIYINENGRNNYSLTSSMDSTFVYFGTYRSRYHCGDLEGTSIIKLFQNANNIIQVFQTRIKIIVTNDSSFSDLDD